MKKLTFSILSALALTALSGAVMAEGFYVALDAGQAKHNIGCGGTVACSNTATAVRITGGYQYTPNVAVELSYGDYGSATGSAVVPPFGLVTAKEAASGFQLSAVGSLPISNNFALTGKLGVANTTVKLSGTALGVAVNVGSTSSTTLAAGVGVRYDFSKAVSLRAQYESLGNIKDPSGQKYGLSLISAGVSFAF